MFEFLKVVHLLALGAGFTAAMTNGVIGPRLGGMEPAMKATVGSFLKIFSRAGAGAVLLLWITGIWMLADKYGENVQYLSQSFWWKMGFVVVLTIDVGIMQYYSIVSGRAGTPPPTFVRLLGMGASVALLLVVVFAVVAFN